MQLAATLGAALQARDIRFVPSNLPPHRPPPRAPGEQRLQMLRCATAGRNWQVDDREIRRGGISWTVDTLRELRTELDATPLCLALGMDAFAGLTGWRDWRDVLDCAHLAVCVRAGVPAPAQGAVAELLAAHRVPGADDLHTRGGGGIWLCEVEPPDCSSHRIRTALAAGAAGDAAARSCLAPAVREYIRAQGLYGTGPHERD